MICKECHKPVYGAQIQKGTGMCKKCHLRIKVEDRGYYYPDKPHNHVFHIKPLIPKMVVPKIPDLALMESLAKSVQADPPKKKKIKWFWKWFH